VSIVADPKRLQFSHAEQYALNTPSPTSPGGKTPEEFRTTVLTSCSIATKNHRHRENKFSGFISRGADYPVALKHIVFMSEPSEPSGATPPPLRIPTIHSLTEVCVCVYSVCTQCALSVYTYCILYAASPVCLVTSDTSSNVQRWRWCCPSLLSSSYYVQLR